MRGIFERPAKSGIWWISYFAEGKRRREKVGRKGDAIKLYGIRRATVLEGRKLPKPRHTKAILLSDLIDLALEFTVDHKDRRSYVSKAEIVRAELGARPAAEITPQEIDRWLAARKSSPATANRYKSFISLCYREGLSNGKVEVNPARLVRQRKEPAGRLRFLSREEYQTLLEHVPDAHKSSLIVSVNAGMRLSEQFTTTWDQVSLERKTIQLTATKNGSARTVRLNPDSLAALNGLKREKPKASARVFPATQTKGAYGTREWFNPALDAAKIEGYTWHGNRHTFCSWLAMAGASIRDIQELAGHKTISMSARYAHLSPEHTLSVIDRIAAGATGVSQVAPEVAPGGKRRKK